MEVMSFANLVSDRSEKIDHHPKIIIDYDTIVSSVKKTNRLVILEEAWPFGNVSTEITYQIQEKAFDYLDAVSYTHLRAPRDRTRSRMPSSA